ncbi:unnamed protein product [Coffea canephora]|uniref:DH200=94 genomic scaffold, scaffold_1712 n=1 Tax=Coffea canephora TaxID=49390 RepID=A0A068VJI5_COFCA|nr:unnamed protein product [Coffea canephora]
MPYLVRENLFIGNTGDAADVLQHGSGEITHIISSQLHVNFIFPKMAKGDSDPYRRVCWGFGNRG